MCSHVLPIYFVKSNVFENKKLREALRNPSLIPQALANRISLFYRLHILKDEFTVAVNKWFTDKGDETLRLKYPLTGESVVFDLGGYRGDFAAQINGKYDCYVYVFEPVRKFYLGCVARFEGNAKIRCFNHGLSDENGSFSISHDNDGSSLIRNIQSNDCDQVLVKKFSDELRTLGVEHIDLLKINIEGSEFPLLREILSKNLMPNIKYLQVQFHAFFPNAKILRDEIRAKLSETHDEEWNYPFVWESWARKGERACDV